MERKKNKKVKGQISSSSLIPVNAIHLPTFYLCTTFHWPHSSKKSVTKYFNVWKLERKINEEIKRRICSSSLIQVYTIHLPTVHVCTKFQSSRPHSSWEKCDEKFSFQRVRNDNHRMTEGQGKFSIAPTFSKRVCNNVFFFQKLFSAVYDIKFGRWNQLNEYMKLLEYQWSRSFTDLGPSHSHSTFSNFLYSITARPIETQILCGASRDGEMEVTSNGLGHMTKMAAMPIKGKNLLFRNQKADDTETWFAAFSTQVLPNLSKWWSWVDPDIFYSKVKFGHFCLYVGKRLNCRLCWIKNTFASRPTEKLYVLSHDRSWGRGWAPVKPV